MTPDPLGDMTLGSVEALVTIIEYASMSCPHCARFALVTFPEIRKRYIETGKVRFIFREFPLDRLAEAVSVVTRCACKRRSAALFRADRNAVPRARRNG